MDHINQTRRKFLKLAAIAGAGAGLSGVINPVFAQSLTKVEKGKRVGIIGLDTSHAIAFTKTLNAASPDPVYSGYQVVAAYPQGSLDIKSSVDRIAGYTVEIQKYGVQIVSSIEELLKKVDVVMLETNDGRVHLKQAMPVLKAGKRLFIDKPIAASYKDAKALFEASEKYKTPMFSTSSLRYLTGLKEVKEGSIGKVLGAYTFSPSAFESTHPDFYWYGIHGIEMLFTIMGTGCKELSRVHTNEYDVVTGVWEDGRVGTFRGNRAGKNGYGATIFGEKNIIYLDKFDGYNPLLKEMIVFFDTGIVPVDPKETLEICAFIEASDLSKSSGGAPVSLSRIYDQKN